MSKIKKRRIVIYGVPQGSHLFSTYEYNNRYKLSQICLDYDNLRKTVSEFKRFSNQKADAQSVCFIVSF